MNNENLNRWLTLCANIGVLIGIILLLVELNQTQEIARAQIRNEIYQGLTDTISMINIDTAQALVKANNGQEMQFEEMILMGGWAETLMRYWENANYQNRMGMYDESEYSAHQQSIKKAITELFPGALIPHYCQNMDGYSKDFITMVGVYVTPEVCAGYERRAYQ